MDLIQRLNDTGFSRVLKLFNDRFLTEQELLILDLISRGSKYTGWWIFELNGPDRDGLDDVIGDIHMQLETYEGAHKIYFMRRLEKIQSSYRDILGYGSQVH